MSAQWANWEENKSFDLQYKRKTMLKWVSIWWTDLKKRPDFLLKAFTRTGCLITLKAQHAIKFPSIPAYKFEYPSFPTTITPHAV